MPPLPLQLVHLPPDLRLQSSGGREARLTSGYISRLHPALSAVAGAAALGDVSTIEIDPNPMNTRSSSSSSSSGVAAFQTAPTGAPRPLKVVDRNQMEAEI